MLVPRSSRQKPLARAAKKGAMSRAAPSTMAASTTVPAPVRAASNRPARTPTTSRLAPPPKSATRLIGGVGGGPADVGQDPGHGQVVDVVPGVLRQGALLAPTRHAAVDQPGVCGEAGLGS